MKTIRKKDLKRYTFIDLFCGIGGFHIALSSFGAKCVMASEIDEKAKVVYKKNFNIEPKGDIRDIRVDEIPEHEILCAGFPCQPFSISGKKMGLEDANGKLFFEIIRVAKGKKPKIMILENVKNLKTHSNGETFRKILKELNKIGYDTFHEVINSSDFGIPQARKRLYIVCFERNLKVRKFDFPVGVRKKVALKDILMKDGIEGLKVENEYKFTIKDEDILYTKNGLIRIGSTGLGRQGERIYSAKGHAITLSSQGGGPAGKTGMYYINGDVRKLHPRECARVMGFSDKFVLSESYSDSYKQLGNSIVVDVVQEILKKIVETMGGTYE